MAGAVDGLHAMRLGRCRRAAGLVADGEPQGTAVDTAVMGMTDTRRSWIATLLIVAGLALAFLAFVVWAGDTYRARADQLRGEAAREASPTIRVELEALARSDPRGHFLRCPRRSTLPTHWAVSRRSRIS